MFETFPRCTLESILCLVFGIPMLMIQNKIYTCIILKQARLLARLRKALLGHQDEVTLSVCLLPELV